MNKGMGRIGIFSLELRKIGDAAGVDAAAELEDLGYAALWVPGGQTGGNILAVLDRLLTGTRTIQAVTTVLNVWAVPPEEVAPAVSSIRDRHPARFLLGLGAGHPGRVEQLGFSYQRPRARVEWFLDHLDTAEDAVPKSGRLLAALGPRMLDLARRRTAGAVPYLVTPGRTAEMREALGPDTFLAPSQAVLFESDPVRARTYIRDVYLSRYLGRRNYTQSLLRQGFTEDDFCDGGSDRLADQLVAWGSDDRIHRILEDHFEAGADHVSVQVVNGDLARPPFMSWRRLSEIAQDL